MTIGLLFSIKAFFSTINYPFFTCPNQVKIQRTSHSFHITDIAILKHGGRVYFCPISSSSKLIAFKTFGVWRKSPEKQGCHERVVAATIAPTLNACRSRTDPSRDLGFAAFQRDTVYSNRAKFGKPTSDSFRATKL